MAGSTANRPGLRVNLSIIVVRRGPQAKGRRLVLTETPPPVFAISRLTLRQNSAAYLAFANCATAAASLSSIWFQPSS
jgi:hypothetical protein